MPQAFLSLANLATKLCSPYCHGCAALFSSPIVSRTLGTYVPGPYWLPICVSGLSGVSGHIPPAAPPYTATYPEPLALCSIDIHVDTAHVNNANVTYTPCRRRPWCHPTTTTTAYHSPTATTFTGPTSSGAGF